MKLFDPTDEGSLGPLDSRIPNFKRKFANIHYQSTLTGEFGTLIIRPNTTEEDVLQQYAKLFPRECNHFISEVVEMNKALHSPIGMGRAKMMASLTKIPELVFMSMKYFDENFWGNKRNVYRFIRKYPRFAVGNRSHKQTKGVIV
jgi:hypothetical protein